MALDWHTRYRRVIDLYRGKLLEVDPVACNEVDDKLYAMGEKWVADQRPVDLDKLMTAGEIAERFGFNVHNIRDWARRHPDKITTHTYGNKKLFLLREVLSFRTGKV